MPTPSCCFTNDREGHATVGHAMVTVLQHHDVGDVELGKLVIKCVRMLVSILQTFYIRQFYTRLFKNNTYAYVYTHVFLSHSCASNIEASGYLWIEKVILCVCNM